MARYSIVNPASFSGMQVTQIPDQEVLLDQRMADFVRLWAASDPPMAALYDVGTLEFDPNKVVQEVGTTVQLNVLSRINMAAKAVTLAFSVGRDLDAIASRYPGGVPRVSSEIYAETDSILDQMKKDTRYRTRIWLSPNTLAAAGTAESYEFFGMTAIPRARDIAATAMRTPEQVTAILSVLTDGDGMPTNAEIVNAYTLINTEAVIPLTDVLSIEPAARKSITYDVDLWFHPWAQPDEVIPAVREALATRLDELRFIGVDHAEIDIGSAIKQFGVHSASIPAFANRDVIEAGPRQFIDAAIGELRPRGKRQ